MITQFESVLICCAFLTKGAVEFHQETQFHPTEVNVSVTGVRDLLVVTTSASCEESSVYNPFDMTFRKFKKGELKNQRKCFFCRQRISMF